MEDLTWGCDSHETLQVLVWIQDDANARPHAGHFSIAFSTHVSSKRNKSFHCTMASTENAAAADAGADSAVAPVADLTSAMSHPYTMNGRVVVSRLLSEGVASVGKEVSRHPFVFLFIHEQHYLCLSRCSCISECCHFHQYLVFGVLDWM